MNVWKSNPTCDLELNANLVHSPFVGVTKRLQNIALQAFQNFLKAFLGNANEPKIFMDRNREGKVFYSVYDPINGDFARLDSEDAVRAWLEQRYYR